MSNNSMIEYKKSFISKIKDFFRNLFKSKKETNTYTSEVSELNNETIIFKENECFNDIKVDTSDIDKYMNKKNFLEYIDGNVDALNLLSVDRLRKLKEYYDGIIEENNKIIDKLRKSA